MVLDGDPTHASELAITWTPEPSARDDLDIEILFDGRHILMGFLVGGQLPLNQL
jgi:hypothetical protein